MFEICKKQIIQYVSNKKILYGSTLYNMVQVDIKIFCLFLNHTYRKKELISEYEKLAESLKSYRFNENKSSIQITIKVNTKRSIKNTGQ